MKLLQIKALLEESKQTGRPIQQAMANGGWSDLNPEEEVIFKESRNYRVRPPEPPKPRDFWMIPGRKEGEFLAYPDDETTPREHWKQAGYTLVREVMEDPK